jgi:hypothetical protein
MHVNVDGTTVQYGAALQCSGHDLNLISLTAP